VKSYSTIFERSSRLLSTSCARIISISSLLLLRMTCMDLYGKMSGTIRRLIRLTLGSKSSYRHGLSAAPRTRNTKYQSNLFIKKAALGPITLNMNKTEIESILGPPEIYCTPDIFGYKKATLWQYGNMEFHFSPDSEQLQIIDNHYTEDKQLFASESRAFELTDLFFFDGDVPLNSHELERKFVDADMNICYYRLDSEVSDTIKIKLESGVEFILEKNEDGLYVPNTIQLFDEASSIDPWTWIRLDWL